MGRLPRDPCDFSRRGGVPERQRGQACHQNGEIQVELSRIEYVGAGRGRGHTSRKVATRFRLVARAPFNLEATVRVLQRRPSNAVDVWDHGRYLRVLALPQGLALLEVEDFGTVDAPDIRFSVRTSKGAPPPRVAAGRALSKMLGLQIDPEPLQRRVEGERGLRDIAPALRGMRPPRFASLFEAFASVVPFQQLSLDAGVAILARLVGKFGRSLELDGRRFRAFPEAEAIAGARLARLRACGLSGRKAQTLRDLARAVNSGAVSEEQLSSMSTHEALGMLTKMPGIGPWSAALVLLRGLGRIDVFPPGDVGAMRGLRVVMHQDPHAPLDRVIERFGQHRGYLYFLALGGSLLSKGLIRTERV